MAEVRISKRPTQLSVSSLQETALFSTTVGLCNNNELLPLILNCDYTEHLQYKTKIIFGEAYKRVEAKANELLSKMHAMGKFKDKIQDLLWPLTYRVIHWKYIYASAIDNQFFQCFHWTHQRRIDSKETAKYIIENQMIPILKRFMLACKLCLMDEISELWKDMPRCDKDLLLSEQEKIHRFYMFWVYQLEGMDPPMSLEEAISLGIAIRSIDATKFLFSLVPEDEKDDAAEVCAIKHLDYLKDRLFLEEEESDICYYVFSQMTKTFQKIFFDSNVSAVLLFLLYSPGQSKLFEVLKDNLDDFSETDIEHLIFVICYKLHLGIFTDYDYCKLVLKIWGILGESYKLHIINSDWPEYCFCYLISDYFRFILTKSPSKKSTKASKSTNIIRHNYDKWQLLHFFIKCEIVTAQHLKENKDRVLKVLRIRKCNKPAWRRLLKFVNDKGVNKNRK